MLHYSEISDSELFDNIKQNSKTKIKKSVSSKKYISIGEPISTTINHFQVYIGKNNKQNDYLTTKLAKKTDLWFHTKDIHGSHVILKIDSKFPSPGIIEKCARTCSLLFKS